MPVSSRISDPQRIRVGGDGLVARPRSQPEIRHATILTRQPPCRTTQPARAAPPDRGRPARRTALTESLGRHRLAGVHRGCHRGRQHVDRAAGPAFNTTPAPTHLALEFSSSLYRCRALHSSWSQRRHSTGVSTSAGGSFARQSGRFTGALIVRQQVDPALVTAALELGGEERVHDALSILDGVHPSSDAGK